MRKLSVDSATSIDNGCVIAFPREKTIGILGSNSGRSLPKSSANPSDAPSAHQGRNRLGKAYKQADLRHRQDVELQNFANQNLLVQQLQVPQMSARSSMTASVSIDHAVADPQMSPLMSQWAGSHSVSSPLSATASMSGGSDALRKAAAVRLIAVSQGKLPQVKLSQGDVDQSRGDKNDFYPSGMGEATAALSPTADISSYIGNMTQELAQLARGANLDLLAYFLEMAELEARMRTSSSLQSA